MTDRQEGQGSRMPYKAEPEKNVVLSDDQIREFKNRRASVRRSIEDNRMMRELDPEWELI